MIRLDSRIYAKTGIRSHRYRIVKIVVMYIITIIICKQNTMDDGLAIALVSVLLYKIKKKPDE